MLSTSSRSAKSDESPSDSESDSESNLEQDFDSTHIPRYRVHLFKDDGSNVQCPVNNLFRDEQDYHNYHLPDKSSKYDGCVAKSIAKRAKRLKVQMGKNIFDSFDSIEVIGFLLIDFQACL